MGKKDFSAPFKIFTLGGMHLLLNPFADIFQSPCNIADDMKSVNDNRCIGEIRFRDFPVDISEKKGEKCR